MDEIARNLNALLAVKRATQRVIEAPGALPLSKAFPNAYERVTAEAARGSVNQFLRDGGARLGTQLAVYIEAYATEQLRQPTVGPELKQASEDLQSALQLAKAERGQTVSGPVHCPWAPTVKAGACVKLARSYLSAWSRETGEWSVDPSFALHRLSAIADADKPLNDRVALLSKLGRGLAAMGVSQEVPSSTAALLAAACFQRGSQVIAYHHDYHVLREWWFDFERKFLVLGGETTASRAHRGMGPGYFAANLANLPESEQIAAIQRLGDCFEDMRRPKQPEHIVGALHGVAYHAGVLLAAHSHSMAEPARMIASGPLADRSAEYLLELALDNPAPECPDECRVNIITAGAKLALAFKGPQETASYLGERRKHVDIRKLDEGSRRSLSLIEARIDMRNGRKPIIDVPLAIQRLTIAGKRKTAKLIADEFAKHCSNIAA